MSYEVGDRVEIVDAPAVIAQLNGKIGEVIAVDSSEPAYQMSIDGKPVKETDGAGTEPIWFFSSELRKVETPTVVASGIFDAPALQVPRECQKVRLYLSAPISGMPEHNFPALNAAADKYRAMGYEVFNPADTGVIDGWSWGDYLRYDLAQLVKCHGIVMLAGWSASEGCKVEYATAKSLGLFILNDCVVGK